MKKIKSDFFSGFNKCKLIWFLFLTELNLNPNAINPLDLIPESFGPVVTDILTEVGQFV